MSDGTKIEWTDATWNPITGCKVVSPGCTNCYAMKLAGTRMRNHPSRAGLTIDGKAGPVWNGQVRFNIQWLADPLRWKRPRRIFVCAHGDLFYEGVPDWWIDRVFETMGIADYNGRGHDFQVLTKRADRMRAYMSARAATGWNKPSMATSVFPPRNAWLGVSVEGRGQKERIDMLRNTPAAVRFLSLEPLLEPLGRLNLDGIHWVIVGGESGPAARPMHPDWVRAVRDQCRDAGVAFFFKQWGEWLPPRSAGAAINEETCHYNNTDDFMRMGKAKAGALLDYQQWREFPRV